MGRSRSRGAVPSFLLAVALLLAPAPSFAALERVGPTVPSHGYPAWYQDSTGLSLEFCSPLSQAELDGGWCLLLPADTTFPETFPAPFSEEHFYWAANAGITFPMPTDSPAAAVGQSNALLVLALEAAFAAGPVRAGDQVAFGRVRIRVNDLPYDGEYTVYTPYGKYVFPGEVAGARLFVTEDVGFTCPPGQFECALATSIGPFLLASNEPGGAELPAVTGPVAGKRYVADPARLGPVTGSPFAPFRASDGLDRNHNIFRIEGPNGFAIETSDFSLMGRIFTDAIPGRVDVGRASYARPAAAGGVRLDVFANASATTQGRLPGQLPTAPVQPSLLYYPVPCATNPATGAATRPTGVAGVRMQATGTKRWGQSTVDQLPLAVCVEDSTARDATGQIVPSFLQAPVTDKVTVTAATYDPANGGSLTVTATTSDAVEAQVLTLVGYGPLDPQTGIVVTPLAAPPERVRVISLPGLGNDERAVETLEGDGTGGGGGGVPVAGFDNVTIEEDAGATDIAILANDTVGTGGIVFGPDVTLAITSPPRLGTAALNGDGTLRYTPNANANGVDDVAYTVTVGGVTSGVAHVTIVITPVNDAPVAVDDPGMAAVVGVRTTIDVLANDTDVDGLADVVVANVTVPAGSALSNVAVVGGLVTFTPTATGTHSFTYFAQDRAGASSATAATVTVTVTARETIAITRAEYRTAKGGRLRVEGTVAPAANQTLTVEVTRTSSGVTGTVATYAVPSTAGAWALDTPVSLDTTGATFGVRVTGPNGGTAAQALNVK